ncbi:hypothetical protein JYU34_003986 [Plutella xylostella]|uniref:Uncharacterized protein n=1 Tax=Plutella xylostella TaxID=51655 RepID=A0ABQ7QWX8_PLUXY|nr:hypothetical protein JYU34_003986 [Plutella xylostella]
MTLVTAARHASDGGDRVTVEGFRRRAVADFRLSLPPSATASYEPPLARGTSSLHHGYLR